MDYPTSRVLTLLELLQSHNQISGTELATRLNVDRRTVRRYIMQLQDLGIPVEAERGRYGAYRLCPGFKLPPLMFSENEAVALTLGLLAARQLKIESASLAVEGALAKIFRVLPQPMRERVQALQQTLVVDQPNPTSPVIAYSILTTLGLAIQQRRQVSLRYEAFTGAVSERMIDPYSLVYLDDCWYAVSYCHLRADLRTFRLDRMLEVNLLDNTFSQPHSFDPVRFVEQSLAKTPRKHQAKVLIKASLEAAQAQIPAAFGKLEVVDEGVLFLCYSETLSWLARFLLDLTLPLVILQPPELHGEMHRLQTRIEEMLSEC
jgi:predicted DNA-binding transcriptional regulator YafY